METTEQRHEGTEARRHEGNQVPAGKGGYSIARAEGKCQVCGRVIAAGEKFSAALRETAVALERLDVCGVLGGI